jgi:hypothetical protein
MYSSYYRESGEAQRKKRVGRFVRMRSEDRKPSKRVFPLLQNLDLDTVTFAQIQSTGNPITIQDMNEQEMLDLIIVNAARLCVKSEWDGLLSAGGGAAPMLAVAPPSASFDYDLTGQSTGSQANNVAFVEDTLYLIPFSVPAAISADNLKFSIASGTFEGTFYVAIYSCDLSTNLPSARTDYQSASISSTGDKTLTFDAGVSLGADTILYAAISWARTSGSCSYGGGYYEYGRSGMPIATSSAISTNSGGCLTYAAAGIPPAELTQSSIDVFVGAAPKIRLGV